MIVSSLAGDDMEERARQIMLALNFPSGAEVPIASRPVFRDKNAVKIGDLHMKPKSHNKQDSKASINSVSITDVEFLDNNDRIAASGKIIEDGSTNQVLKALAKELVMNSLPLDVLVSLYELRTNEVGEFCVVRMMPDKTTGELAVDPSTIYFVRSGKAVILKSHSKDKDARTTAKALDKMLSGVASK
jgi:hypothetical protein